MSRFQDGTTCMDLTGFFTSFTKRGTVWSGSKLARPPTAACVCGAQAREVTCGEGRARDAASSHTTHPCFETSAAPRRRRRRTRWGPRRRRRRPQTWSPSRRGRPQTPGSWRVVSREMEGSRCVQSSRSHSHGCQWGELLAPHSEALAAARREVTSGVHSPSAISDVFGCRRRCRECKYGCCKGRAVHPRVVGWAATPVSLRARQVQHLFTMRRSPWGQGVPDGSASFNASATAAAAATPTPRRGVDRRSPPVSPARPRGAS